MYGKRLRVTDWKYREWLARLEKWKILKLCLKNAFREPLSKIFISILLEFKVFEEFTKNENIAFCLIKYAKISGKLTKFSVFALKQFTKLELGVNLA